MIAKIYVQMTEYNSAGWELRIVNNDDYDYYNDAKDSFLLDTIALPEPDLELLAQVAQVKIDDMQEKLARANMKAQETIKEFESKFLLIGAPVVLEGFDE